MMLKKEVIVVSHRQMEQHKVLLKEVKHKEVEHKVLQMQQLMVAQNSLNIKVDLMLIKKCNLKNYIIPQISYQKK